jgi:hypothetical protein
VEEQSNLDLTSTPTLDCLYINDNLPLLIIGIGLNIRSKLILSVDAMKANDIMKNGGMTSP